MEKNMENMDTDVNGSRQSENSCEKVSTMFLLGDTVSHVEPWSLALFLRNGSLSKSI